MKLLEKISTTFFGDRKQRQIKPYLDRVDEINALSSHYEGLSDEELKTKTSEFKDALKNGASLDDLLANAFATVREASKRVLGMRHFDVQLIGGMVLHEGRIAEMKTGEGKTLVSTLPAYLNALEGKGVYVVTVNDYLAKRDSEWMGQIFTFLGLTVGLIQSGMNPDDRIAAYACDITYGTNNEYGFDYLRDNLAMDLESCCQTRRHFAIIDEVDSILIDEARTPLIISGPVQDSTGKYLKVSKICKTLKEDEDFTSDEKHKNIVLTEDGIDKIEAEMGVSNMYSVENMEVAHMAVQCLRAMHLFQKDVDYVVKDGQVMIVDEFTGRILEGRRYSDGLHQAIEAINNLQIKEESQTLASVTYQNYFRMFPKLAGMTGTAVTEVEEFINIYGLNVVEIPTNKPIQRRDESDLVYKTRVEKFNAIANEIEDANKKGQPVLAGTVSIEKSEYLSQILKKKGVRHNVLNAKYHEREADIIAEAGQKGAVTIATNMAGRGTDIVLGDGVKELGGLFVIGTERHESRRIDNQLRGRSGRQGDPGRSRFFVALDDDLMRLFGSDRIAKVMETLGLPDDTPIEHSLITRSIEKAQSKVEKYHFSVRKQILQFDDVMTKQRDTIYGIRKKILEGDGISDKFKEMVKNWVVGTMSVFFPENGIDKDSDLYKEFLQKIQSVIPVGNFKDILSSITPEQMAPTLIQVAYNLYDAKQRELPPGLFEQLVTKRIMLMNVDKKWMEHLHNMDILREGIGLRAYGQRDPLIEYKKEGFDMFKELLYSIADESITSVYRSQLVLKGNDGSEMSPQELEKLMKPQSPIQKMVENSSEETTDVSRSERRQKTKKRSKKKR